MSATVASAPARKQIISERQRRSAVWRIIHLLGSLQLALILLATIAIACAIATFAESNFNTKIAQTYIYKAPWFQIWLAVLCVNLFAVTLTRWPWQKRHIGFVVTHYGIITLLIGAMIGMQTGFEGNVTLRKDTPPVNRITTSRSIIQLQSPADSALYLMRFDAEATRPSARRPRSFPVPGTDLKVVADDFSPNLIREQRLVASKSPNAGQSVLLKLSSSMAGQSVDVPLSLDRGQAVDRDFFGLARISFRHALSQPATSLPDPSRGSNSAAFPLLHLASDVRTADRRQSGRRGSTPAPAPRGRMRAAPLALIRSRRLAATPDKGAPSVPGASPG
jgi:hypothetical protein